MENKSDENLKDISNSSLKKNEEERDCHFFSLFCYISRIFDFHKKL